MADADLQDIINTLLAEGVGEGPEGMRRIAETIINRAAVRGMTPAQVVRQPHQYTGYSAPGPAAVKAQQDPKWRSAAQAAWELALQPGDPTNGADHYYAPGTVDQPYWAGSMTDKGEYGGHRFFSSRPIPPGEVANVVASELDVTPPSSSSRAQTPRTFRYTDQDTGNLLGYEPQPLPAARSGLQDVLNRGPDFTPTRLPELPPSATRLTTPVPQSTIERSPPRPTIPQSMIERSNPVGPLNRPVSTPALLAGADLSVLNRNPVTPFLTQSGNGVTDPASIALFGNKPDYLSIGSLPTFPTSAPALVVRPQSYAGQDSGPSYRPTTYAGQDRATPTFAPTLTATNRPQSYVGQERASPSTSDDTGSGAGSFSTFSTLLGLRPSTIGQPPTTRIVPSISVAGKPASSTPLTKPASAPAPKYTTVASFPTTGQGITSSVLDNYRYNTLTNPGINANSPERLSSNAPGPGSSGWNPNIGSTTPQRVSQVGVNSSGNAAPLPYNRPVTQVATALDVIPPPSVKPATPAAPAAPAKPTYVTQMKPTTIENPAYTKWKADNLAAERKSIPLGDVMHFTSRDSVAQAAAGQNAAAKIFPPAPAQYITVQRPVQVLVPPKPVAPPPVVVPPKPVVVPPVYKPPVAAPAPVPLVRPPTTPLGMFGGGQSQPLRPAVGTNLGIAANGGVVTQGYNGLLNSQTQNSDYWQNATSGGDISNGPARAVVNRPPVMAPNPVSPVRMVQAFSGFARR